MNKFLFMAILLLLIFTSVSSAQNLVLYTTLDAYSIRLPHTGPRGTQNGGSFVAAKYNDGFLADDNSEYVDFNIGASSGFESGKLNETTGSILFWFKPSYSGKGDGSNKFIFSVNGSDFSLFYDDFHERITFRIQNTDRTVFTPTWSSGDLVHIAVVWDAAGSNPDIDGGKSIAMYLNGSVIDWNTSTWTPGALDATNFRIGADAGNPIQEAQGAIDDLYVYDDVLTSAEINNLKDNPLPAPAPPKFAGGSGTEEDPYQIASASQLDSVLHSPTEYFIQIAGIDLDVSPFNTGPGWSPIGTSAASFAGSYDGNGYKISNLYINRSAIDNVGLFGANDGTIKNLALVNVNIIGAQFAGAIAGRNFEVISNCYSTGSVNGTNYVGGITGHSMNDAGTGLIEKCYSTASVSGNSHVGGISGRLYDGLVGVTLTQCYSVGAVTGSSSIGGLLGSNSGGTASSNFWDTETSEQASSAAGTGKTTDEMRGIAASNNISDWSWDTSTWERIGQNYPTLKVIRAVNLDNIGDSGFSASDFRDIGFKSETGIITVDFEFFDDTTPTNIPDGSRSVGKYWDVLSISGNTKIRLYYTADEKSSFTGTPKIYHYTGGAWVELPTETEVDIDGTNFYVQTTNYYSSFSPVTVGDDAAPLPVELTFFEGYNTEDGVLLKWETATETNNYGFQVQRTKDKGQSEWEDVGFVQGNGTTNSPKNYEFTDSELPNSQSVDYRLKQIDNDGTFAYSKIVTVDLTTITSVEEEIPVEYSLSQNYPNPFNPITTIKFGLPKSDYVELTVYNILGQNITQLVNKELQAGNHEVTFDASNLSSGMYFYRIDVGGKFELIKKMLLLR